MMAQGKTAALFLIALVLIALACIQVSMAEVSSVNISSQLDPNAILITEVDIIFVYSKEIVDDFPGTRTAWYSGKRAFTRNAGDKVDIVNIFIPQGFDSVRATLPERRSEALKVYVFAEHDDSKAAPVDITELVNVLIEIDSFGIRVSRL